MAEIMKKITKLMKDLDRLVVDVEKVIAAGKEIRDSLPKKPDDEHKE